MAPSIPTLNSRDTIQEDWPPTYDEYTDMDWCDEKIVDSQMFQDLIEENQSPIYDEYADFDWYDILNSPLPVTQVRVDPPPKPPDPTNGHIRGNHEHNSHGEVDAEPYRNINGYILRSSYAKDKATRGIVQETSQNESDSDPLKVRTGRKPKERQEHSP